MASRNWTKNQKEAIYQEADNILVSASAGSGKTAVLVERVIDKVTVKNIDIDKILVVTFTNAAASELKERLLDSIYKKLKKEPNNMFLKRQISLINRASITTIHSFCLDIIRSNFDILDIDPSFSIGEETQLSILKDKAISKILDGEYTNDEKKQNISLSIFKILELFSGKEENFSKYILTLYSYIQSFEYPFEWLDKQIEKYLVSNDVDLYETEFGKEIYSQVIEELKLVGKKIELLLDEISGNDDFIKHYTMLSEDLDNINNCINTSGESWDRLYFLLNNMSFSRMPSYKGTNLNLKEKISTFRKRIIKESVENAKKSVYADSKKIIEDNKKAYIYLKYIQEFLVKFHEEYSNLKKANNIIDFNDIEHLALELLITKSSEGKYLTTQIADELQEKYVEVYTDEYQDTSYIQEAILEAVSGSKKRFMVGDIKQSIYKFRQAMPEIFNLKYRDYEALDAISNNQEYINKNIKIELASNFRSRKGVLHSINYIFEKIMSEEVGDCTYNDEQALKVGNLNIDTLDSNNYKTDINILDFKPTVLDTDTSLDDTSSYIDELKKIEVEAYLIAKKIKELKNNFKVYNKDNKTFETTSYKDIVILLRSIKDSGSILEKTLKKEGIPAFCDFSTNIFDGEEIRLVLSFLKVLDNPYQDVNLAGIMYSIIGKFDLDELVYIRNADFKDYLYNNILDTKNILESLENKSDFQINLLNKITNFLSVLKKFVRYSKIYTISELLEKLYKETNIYTQFLIDNMALYRKANLDLLVELAVKFQNNSKCTLSSYITYIESLENKSDLSLGSAKVLGENEDVVRIMTIHKSKGLEFPIVILSNTSKRYNLKDGSSSITMHHKLGLGVNIVDEDLKVTYPSVVKQAIKQKIAKESKSEELRMLYVALTRAKEKLVVFSSVDDYEKKKEKLQVILNKEGKIEPQLILNNNSYSDNIIQVLNIYETDNKSEELFDINIINVKSNDDLINIGQSEEELDTSINERIDNIKNKYLMSVEESKKEDYKKLLKENIQNKYLSEEDSKTRQRISVSSLKKEHDNNILTLFENKEKSRRIPVAINEENNYAAVRKGILVHFILEHLDFKKEYNESKLKEYIQNLMNSKVISESDAKHLNISKILKFLNSDICPKETNVKKIYREEEFILKDNNFTKSVIQGIIDLYYITNDDKIILIDFKTDRNKDKNYYIQKYKKQLEIYKEAIETLTSKTVYKSYIYSFELEEGIEI